MHACSNLCIPDVHYKNLMYIFIKNIICILYIQYVINKYLQLKLL